MPVRRGKQNPGPPEELKEGVKSAVQQGDLEELVKLFEEWKRQLGSNELPPENLDIILGWAVKARQKDLIAYILDQGSKFDNETLSPSYYQAESNLEIYQLFIDHGWNLNEVTALSPLTLLEHEIASPRVVKWCLEHGADPNRQGRAGGTALDAAAGMSTPEVVRMLVQHGGDLSRTNAVHNTVLAAPTGDEAVKTRLEVLAMLLDEYGMDINARSTFPDRNPWGGMDVNGTPLHDAVYADNAPAVKFLLERGANRMAPNAFGQPVTAYAEEFGSDEMKELLRWPF